jgi:putative endonuclease
MAEHNDTGREGECIAVEYLRNEGYQILEQNWQSHRLEIDIIAIKDDVLIIVEVKCRRGTPLLEPYLAVNRNKQNQLIKAANAYIFQKDIDMEARFDVISVTLGNTPKIEHIQGAFYPRIR